MVKIVKEETIPRGRHADTIIGASFFKVKHFITESSSFSRVTGLTLLLLLFATPFIVTRRQIFQPHAAGGAPDVTSSVEMLGNPSMSRYPSDPYSRNVWDMQAFNNKIYIGSGDFLANTGPVPILAYDTSSSQFVTDPVINSNEGTSVDEEQINEFDIGNNQIYIPGTDPRDSNGEFYRLETNGWTKYPTINNAVHDWSMASYSNQLFIAINSSGNTSPIDISSDNGQTWQSASYVNPQGNPASIVSGYGGSFFQINGILYTSSNITIQDGSSQITSNIFKYVGNNQFMIVENSPLNSPNPVRPVNFNNGVVYIGLTSPIKTDFYNYGNLYFSNDINNTQKITLPANTTVWDFLQRGNTAYALTNTQQADGSYIISVLSSTDGLNWSELFHFSAPTFAVSFEESSGDFYFGLGTHHTPLMTQAGNILRVKQAAYFGGNISSTPSPSVTLVPTLSPTPTPTSVNFNSSVSVSPLPVQTGQAETITSNLTNLTASTVVGEVKLTVINPQDAQVFSQMIPSSGTEQFQPNTPKVNTASFALSASAMSGTYTIDEKILASDGVTVLYDNPSAASFSVTAPTPTPTLTPTPSPTPTPTVVTTTLGDLNSMDGVNAIDLSLLLSAWGTVNDTMNAHLGKPAGSVINALSLSVLLSHWTM